MIFDQYNLNNEIRTECSWSNDKKPSVSMIPIPLEKMDCSSIESHSDAKIEHQQLNQMQNDINTLKEDMALVKLEIRNLQEMFNSAHDQATKMISEFVPENTKTKPKNHNALPTVNLFFDNMAINYGETKEQSWGHVIRLLQTKFNVLNSVNESILSPDVINVYFVYKSTERMDNMWNRQFYEKLYQASKSK